MYVLAVTLFVKPEFVDQFIEATYANARGSRTEPANVRWDFSQAEDDPTRFLLYEVYTSQAGHLAHQQTPHYLTWKNTVAEWMSQPRVGVKHKALFFGDKPVV